MLKCRCTIDLDLVMGLYHIFQLGCMLVDSVAYIDRVVWLVKYLDYVDYVVYIHLLKSEIIIISSLTYTHICILHTYVMTICIKCSSSAPLLGNGSCARVLVSSACLLVNGSSTAHVLECSSTARLLVNGSANGSCARMLVNGSSARQRLVKQLMCSDARQRLVPGSYARLLVNGSSARQRTFLIGYMSQF
jgi:hypothetical protein